MSERLLLDTDVLIDYLRNRPEAVAFVENRQEPFLVSVITVAELFAGVRDGHERTTLAAFLSAFEWVAVNGTIAERGGLYRRDYGKSHGTGLADALIAATAEYVQADLITLNGKHFPMLGTVGVPYSK